MEETGMDHGKECCCKEEVDCSEDTLFNTLSGPPSLENLALVSIAIRLCGNPDLTESRYRNEIDTSFENLKNSMFDKLAQITLPRPLKVKIAKIIGPIGSQLQQLIDLNHHEFCSLREYYREGTSYYWTMEGTIDKVKSLKEIINSAKNLSEKENFNDLYEKASYYCLDDCISDLWLKISDEIHKFDYRLDMFYSHHMLAYWDAVRKNKLPSFIGWLKQYDNRNMYDCNLSIYENMVSLSAFLANEISFKYFWYKLTNAQKISGLDKWLRLSLNRTPWLSGNTYLSGYKFDYQYCEARTNIMCFLMSHLSREKQEEILEIESEQILLSLFNHWPLQRFFLPAITATFHFLQEDVYIRILSAALFKIRREAELFPMPKHLWQISPLRLKKAFVQFFINNSAIVQHLIRVGDDITIDMILSFASSAEKKQIISLLFKEQALRYLLYKDATVVLTLDRLVSKALSSQVDVLHFKQYVESDNADFLCRYWLIRGDIQATETFLKWIFQSKEEIREYKKKNIKPMPIYKLLIHSSNCEPAELFLNWYFETQEELLQFKTTFVHGAECSACIWLLSSFFREGKVGWFKFEKFLNYGYLSSEELIKLKKRAFDSKAKFFVDNHAFEFATLFLQWCLDSSDEINRFKTEVLLSEKIFMRLIIGNSNPNWEEVKKVLKWFSPSSKEVIAELKSALAVDFNDSYIKSEENLSEKKLILFDLLDSLSEERQMPEHGK